MPFQKVLTGKEILQYTSAILKVEYVKDLPVPADKQATYQQGLAATANAPAGIGMKRFPDEGDLASALVRYKNGSFTMEGQLDAQVRCQHNQMGTGARMWDIHVCWANLKYTHAPEAQFTTVSAISNGVIESVSQQWLSAYLNEQARVGQRCSIAKCRRTTRGWRPSTLSSSRARRCASARTINSSRQCSAGRRCQ